MQIANKKHDSIKQFKYLDGRLLSFSTSNDRYRFLYKSSVLTPNKFVNLLGFGGYSAFLNSRFSKLRDYETRERMPLWYNGYFGGLVGLNKDIVNDYVSTGEVLDIYDYDINQAYLYELTQYLPTKFLREMSPKEFEELAEIDKIPHIYFFEIVLKSEKINYFKCIGRIRSRYSSLDFINSKQHEHMIVSEKRLSLINQIYFKDYEVKKVYEFERKKFNFYEKILFEYLQRKNSYGPEFKIDALRLYGTLGQIYKYKEKDFRFEDNGDLIVSRETFLNEFARPHVAMWVADSVATKLFDIISLNYDKILSWNTDGVTSLGKLPLQVSIQSGKWKLNHFRGLPFLLNASGARLFYKNIETGEIVGAKHILEKNGVFYEKIEYSYSNLKRGFVKVVRKYKLNKFMQFEQKNTFRNMFLREKFIHGISREYQKF